MTEWTLERARTALEDDLYRDYPAWDALRFTLTQLEWQPIETAPKDGTCIIAWENGSVEIAWWYGDAGVWLTDFCRVKDERFDPTHWRPIGPDPKEDKP